jgi:long-chain acyl-CoA synthetase
VRELQRVEAKAVVVGPAGRVSWEGVEPGSVPSLEMVITGDGLTLGDAMAIDDLRTAEAVPVVEVEPSTLAVLLFTSGTAGAPQAAMLTHDNLLSNLEQSMTSPGRIAVDDVVFGALPLYHVFGLNVVLGLTLSAGASLVLVQRFDPMTALDTIVERGITVIPGVPPMWGAWAQLPLQPVNPFAKVRLALSGAAKLPEDVSRHLAERYGIQVREGYGLTEASPVVTTSAGMETRSGSVGKVLPGIDVRLVDPLGDDVLEGDAGEVWVRGRNVFAGYWHDQVATDRVLRDGWLRTGDVAVVDSDGYLYLVDRAKDLIIVSGFNVYPAEVEEIIAEIPGVAEVAVVGVAHPHTGETVKAYVVPDPETVLDEELVIQYCAENLARYKCPTKVLFVSELPRGAAGKILRRVLR